MDLFDLMKAGSLIFSRSPARDMMMIDALKEERANKKAIGDAFGPNESNGVRWHTPRQLPTGRVSAMVEPQGPTQPGLPMPGSMGPMPLPPQNLQGSARAPMPAIPVELFSEGVRNAGLQDFKQRLMKAPKFQEAQAALAFAPPKPPIELSKGGKLIDPVTHEVVASNEASPELPSEVISALWQAGGDAEKARGLLAKKGQNGEWALDKRTKLPVFVSATDLLSDGGQNYTKPPSGMKIQADGQGGFTMVTGDMVGGDDGLTKPTQTSLEQTIIQSGDAIARLEGIKRQFKPEYQQLGMRWQNMVAAGKEKLGIPLDEATKGTLTAFSEYRRNAAANQNQTIKDLTGATVSVQEAPRLMLQMPTTGQGLFDGDSPTEFAAKLDGSIAGVKAAQARASYARKHGLSKDQMFAMPLDSIPAMIDKRGDEYLAQIRQGNPGIPDETAKEMVKARLREEFGL